jgi:hypothetical protein
MASRTLGRVVAPTPPSVDDRRHGLKVIWISALTMQTGRAAGTGQVFAVTNVIEMKPIRHGAVVAFPPPPVNRTGRETPIALFV